MNSARTYNTTADTATKKTVRIPYTKWGSVQVNIFDGGSEFVSCPKTYVHIWKRDKCISLKEEDFHGLLRVSSKVLEAIDDLQLVAAEMATTSSTPESGARRYHPYKKQEQGSDISVTVDSYIKPRQHPQSAQHHQQSHEWQYPYPYAYQQQPYEHLPRAPAAVQISAPYVVQPSSSAVVHQLEPAMVQPPAPTLVPLPAPTLVHPPAATVVQPPAPTLVHPPAATMVQPPTSTLVPPPAATPDIVQPSDAKCDRVLYSV